MHLKDEDDFDHYFNATARLTKENTELRTELDKAHRLLSQMIGWQRDAEVAKAKLQAEFKRFMIVCGEGTAKGRAIDLIPKKEWERACDALG